MGDLHLVPFFCTRAPAHAHTHTHSHTHTPTHTLTTLLACSLSPTVPCAPLAWLPLVYASNTHLFPPCYFPSSTQLDRGIQQLSRVVAAVTSTADVTDAVYADPTATVTNVKAALSAAALACGTMATIVDALASVSPVFFEVPVLAARVAPVLSSLPAVLRRLTAMPAATPSIALSAGASAAGKKEGDDDDDMDDDPGSAASTCQALLHVQLC